MSKKQTQKSRIIGIDLHPSCFAAAAFSKGKKQLWLHERIEIGDLKNWLENNIKSTDTLILEAGCNSFEFCRIVTTFGAGCIILDSIKVGQIGKTYCKTDKHDAQKIAKIYLSDLANNVWVPDKKTTLRREVLSKFQQAKKSLTKTKNMIRSYMTEHNLQKPQGLKLYTEKGKIWLKKSYKWDAIQFELIDILFNELEHTKETKKKIARIMILDIMNDAKVFSLVKLCGVRCITAFAIAAAVGDISRFENSKKLAAYLGLIPSVNQSGENKRHGGVGKGGRKETRSFIVQGAQALLKASDEYGGGFKTWGWKIVHKKGRNVATIAVARKMAVAAWYHLKGHKTNIHIPPKSIKTKVDKIAQELGAECIKSLGYKNSREFKDKIEEKLLEVA